MRAVSLLVLLGCSLLEGQSVSVNDITRSHYGGRENQIQAENTRTEPPATASTQQSCQPDIHSVLREMSAMLAELRVEQRHTTTAVTNMESRLRACESHMEELKKKVEAQTQINEAQTVNQTTMEARFGTELKDLKRQNDERKVVFSVGLSGGEEDTTGPYNTQVTLVYKDVFINIGNAYNPATGIFTAPVRGVYQFRFHILGYGGKAVDAALHKNGRFVAGAYGYQSNHVVNSSNGVSLLLEVGDIVCLKLRANSWIYDDSFHHTTFSGQMLFSV